MASAVRCSKSPRYRRDRVARVGRLQPPVHSQRLDGREDRIGPTLGDEDGHAALTAGAQRVEEALLVEGRAVERELALGLLDRRVPVVGLAGVQAPQPGRDLRGDPPADRGEEAVHQRELPHPERRRSARRVDSAGQVVPAGSQRIEEVGPGVLRHHCRQADDAPARAAPLAVLEPRVLAGREQQPCLPAAVGAADRRHVARVDAQRGIVRQQAGQIARVAHLEVLRGQLDRALGALVPPRRVVQDRVSAVGEPYVVPAHGLVRIASAIGPVAAARVAELLALGVQEAVEEDDERESRSRLHPRGQRERGVEARAVERRHRRGAEAVLGRAARRPIGAALDRARGLQRGQRVRRGRGRRDHRESGERRGGGEGPSHARIRRRRGAARRRSPRSGGRRRPSRSAARARRPRRRGARAADRR